MSDILFAFGVSAGILLSVVVLIIIVSIVAVNRGAQAMAAESGLDHAPDAAHATTVTAAGAAAKPAKAPAAAAGNEISVLQILGFGAGIFVVAVLALFALSLIEHLG
jgi:hypothetical protein